MIRPTFKSNVNKNGSAGIKVTSGCRLKLQNGSFIGNFGKTGSVLDIDDGVHVIIEDSIFKNNTAWRHGGVMRVHKSVVWMLNCHFMDNFAKKRGGVVNGEVSYHFIHALC